MRVAAALLLGTLLGQDDPARRAEDFVRRLGSDRVGERDAAIRGLLALGRPAVPALEKAASDPDGELAGRARDVLRRLAVRESFSPRLRAILPGIEDRLDLDRPWLWTEAFLAAVERREGKLVHPEIRAEDLEVLAPRALRGARAERPAVVREIGRWGLRSAAAELLPLLGEEDFDQRFRAGQVLKHLETREIVPKVLSLLRHSNPVVRGSAAQLLIDWNVRECIPEMLRMLEEGDASDRGYAQVALVRFRATETIPALIPLLEKPAPGPFTDAVQALAGLRSAEAAPKLIALLRSENPHHRSTAARAFCVLRDPEAVPELGRILEREDEAAWYTALEALLAAGTPQAADEIVRRALRSRNPELRTSAFSALCVLGFRETIPDVVGALRDEDPRVREGALNSLESLEARETIPEIVRLLDQEADPSVLMKGVQALQGLRAKEARAAVEQLLAHPRLDVRQVALHALGELGHKTSAPAILKALEELQTRREAARAAGRLGLQEAVPRLTALLDEEPHAGMRAGLLEALADLGAPDAVPALIRIHSQEVPPFPGRSAAERARLNDRSLIPLLMAALKGGEEAGQQEVIQLLHGLQATEAVPALAALLDDPDAGRRDQALLALGGIRGREAIPAVARRLGDAEYRIRAQAIWTLRHLDGREAAPVLLRRVEEDEDLGMRAADLLADWGVRDVLPALERRTRAGYASLRAQVRAIRFSLGDRGTVPDVLQGIEWGETWVAHRMMTLAAEKGLEEAVPAIRARLNDPDPGVRVTAATALVRLGRLEGAVPLLEQRQGWSLLNRLCRPEEFRRLDGRTVQGALTGTARQIAGRIAKEAGLSLVGPPPEWSDDPAWDREIHRLANVGDRLTRLQVLEQVLGYRYAFLCEPGGIRILRRGEALHHWRAWSAESGKAR